MSGIQQQPILGNSMQQQQSHNCSCNTCSCNPCKCGGGGSSSSNSSNNYSVNDPSRGYGGLGLDQQSHVQHQTQMESDQQALRDMNDRRLVQQQHRVEDNKHPSATGITNWENQDKTLSNVVGNNNVDSGLTPIVNTETSKTYDPNTNATTVHQDKERSLGDKITGKLSGMMQSITGGSGTTHSSSQLPDNSGFSSATASGGNPKTHTYVGQDDQGNRVHYASSSSHS